ncbi:MAG: hypothetical protein HY905_26235 [Deltaproteobacteria bacterium]|nr:hypothetical protein [Deltaproteobacteria bacterium]
MHRIVVATILALAAAFVAAGCGGDTILASRDRDADRGTDAADDDAVDGGADADAGSDADADESEVDGWWWSPDVVPEHVELPTPDEPPQCGDGVVDEGEECDDRNRLNGDGCDWQCRLGDGEPPPEPEPGVTEYDVTGPSVTVSDTGPFDPGWERLPLTWNGTEFATVSHENAEEGYPIRFRRFGRDGVAHLPDWTYAARTLVGGGLELVWTGSGYGLFYVEAEWGIFYLRLDVDGKPMGTPVLVEPDPLCAGTAADVSGDGYLLVWHTGENRGTCGGWDYPPASVRARFVGLFGETAGDPIVIDGFSGGAPDVATGSGGFGFLVYVNSSPERPSCAQRFVHLNSDLSVRTPSGVLSDGPAGDVKWVDGRYVTAWGHYDTGAGGDSDACVAWFDDAGAMTAPPVCNAVTPSIGSAPVRVAAGDEGLALVAYSDAAFVFQRTDLRGVAVGVPGVVGFGGPPGPCNTVWADGGFGILYGVGSGSAHMYFSYFAAVE